MFDCEKQYFIRITCSVFRCRDDVHKVNIFIYFRFQLTKKKAEEKNGKKTRLWIFMQIYIFTDTDKKAKLEQTKFLIFLDILYISEFMIIFVHFFHIYTCHKFINIYIRNLCFFEPKLLTQKNLTIKIYWNFVSIVA